MGIKYWRVPEPRPELEAKLAEETGLPPIVCRVLAARGVRDGGEAARFVGRERELDDPFLLADMGKAVERIQRAIGDGGRIAVYGDYDCDGVTATALLVSYLQSVGADVIYYIPSRDKEGYGMNRAAVDVLAGQRVELIVTVDNGISAHDEIEYAKSLKIDTVVTDHHTPRDTLPDAVAVVNPHRADCPSRFKELAGVGVAFKLVSALEGAGAGELLEYYAELVALGTIADVVPLTGENRVIVRYGLARLPETENPGIDALIRASGLRDRAFTSETAAFTLIPRINAVGRVGTADDVVELLLTDDASAAGEMAGAVNEMNAERRRLEDAVLRDVEGILAATPEILNRRILIVSGESWHHGVVGIVSAKLMERYDRPVILFSTENGEARGSGRSVRGFSLIEAIAACDRNLTRYGGHILAAGLTLPAEHLAAFCDELEAFARERYDVMPIPELAADAVLGPGELTVEGVAGLAVLEPFGAGNEPPLFCLSGFTIEGVYPTGDGKHIRVRVSSGGASFYAVWFGMTGGAFPYRPGERVDLMARIAVEEYNGKTQLSVRIADLRLTDVPQERMLGERERYAAYRRGEPGQWDSLIPSREDVALVYRFLRRSGAFPYGRDALYLRLPDGGTSYGRMAVALDVLEEMGLIRRDAAESEPSYAVIQGAPKADLEQSRILMRLRS